MARPRARLFETSDFPELDRWLEARGMPISRPSLMPKHGVIVEGIAAGFIYLTDGGIAILDYFVSNPKSDKSERDQSLDVITLSLIQVGHAHGIHAFKCDTKIIAVKERARRLGFMETGEFTAFFREV